MENLFEVDGSFKMQADSQRGGGPVAPSGDARVPEHPYVTLQQKLPPNFSPEVARRFENLAERTAPGSAVSDELTYRWR